MTSPTPGSPPCWLRIAGRALLLCSPLFSSAQCLLVNRGSQSPGTMAVAIVGFFLLYMGLRFLLGRLEQNSDTPALFRFLGGVLAGLVIFLA